jgi:hypothetical protein
MIAALTTHKQQAHIDYRSAQAGNPGFSSRLFLYSLVFEETDVPSGPGPG